MLVEWTAPVAEEEEEIEGAEWEEGESLLRGGGARNCRGGFGPIVGAVRVFPYPQQLSGKGEPKAVIQGLADISCPVGIQRIKLEVCVQKWGGDVGPPDWHDQACTTRYGHIKIEAGTSIACRAGTQRYRISAHFHAYQIGPDIDSEGTSNPKTYTCNNAGAWRYSAKIDSSSPSTTLGLRLIAGSDNPPSSTVSGPRNGFAAHHIVPWNLKTKAAAGAEAIAWACGLGLDTNVPTVNDRANGSWLRGPMLAKAGDGGAKKDTPGYRSLSSAAKRRAYHPTLHSNSHFTWIAIELSRALGPEGNWECDQGEAAEILAEIKDRLETGGYVK